MKISFLCAALLLFVTNITFADEVTEERWDDKYFGITFEKPDKGRYWVVAGTRSFSSGDKLKEGDEILDINRKRVTVDDDVIEILRSAGDSVEIRAKRNRVISRATFEKLSLWEMAKKPFVVEHDKINEWDTYRPKGFSDVFTKATHFEPSVIFVDGHPETMVLRFEYFAKDWLFIERMTLKIGDQSVELKRDHLSGVKQEVLRGGIKEWFTIVGSEAKKVNDLFCEGSGDITIRLHGRDYYKDIPITELEVDAFEQVGRLWKFGKQRKEDLKK